MTINNFEIQATPPERTNVAWLNPFDGKIKFYIDGEWKEYPAINKGEPGGVASLDAAGKVPSQQLPSYVDDVIEVEDYAHLPEEGESGKIYLTLDTGNQYRWSGSTYIPLNENNIEGDGVKKIIKLTAEEYNALATKDSNAIYLVSDGISNGVYIYYTDNSMSPYDELVEGKTPLGVAVLTDSVKILLNPDCDYDGSWSQDISTIIDDVVTVEDYDSAVADLNGESNTAAIIASGLQGSAFDFVASKGQGWYLPSFGELQQLKLNEEDINVALELMSGEPIYFSAYYLWSSTQYNEGHAWCNLYDEPDSDNYLEKTASTVARAIKALSISGPSLKIYFDSILIADSSLPDEIEALLATI